MSQVDDIVRRLEEIDEELAQLAIDRLTASITDGDSSAATDERTITKARRAVAKATGVLADLS